MGRGTGESESSRGSELRGERKSHIAQLRSVQRTLQAALDRAEGGTTLTCTACGARRGAEDLWAGRFPHDTQCPVAEIRRALAQIELDGAPVRRYEVSVDGACAGASGACELQLAPSREGEWVMVADLKTRGISHWLGYELSVDGACSGASGACRVVSTPAEPGDWALLEELAPEDQDALIRGA